MERALAEAIPSSDRGAFDGCVMQKRCAARVQADVAEGKRLGVTGTPEFLVGCFDASHPDELKCMRRLSGTAPIGDFDGAIESVLEAEAKDTGGSLAGRNTEDHLMSESAFGAFIGQPVPAVRAGDVRAFSPFWSSKIGRDDLRARQLISRF